MLGGEILALLNGMYIFVEDESINRDVDITSHPVEKGIDISDSVKIKPVTVSLKGKIVHYGGESSDAIKSWDILAKIKDLQRTGSLVNYSGRNILKNYQIRSFNSTHPNTNAHGLDFDMELSEVRIAQPITVKVIETVSKLTKAQQNLGTQQVQQGENKAVYHTVKKGETIWGLVNKNYKDLNTTCETVIKNNPNAFSRPGDATTLQIGAKLFMGNRK